MLRLLRITTTQKPAAMQMLIKEGKQEMMNMYETLKIEIITFETGDIIVTSNVHEGGEMDD